MLQLTNEQLYEILIRSLNRVNDLLVGHGERVAYGMMRLLEQDGRFSEEEIGQIVWTVLFHDIGNFRKTDTWNLVQLENDDGYSHATYGYVFLKAFFPFAQYTPIVRYHHSTDAEIEQAAIAEKLKWAIRCLRAVDSTDLYFLNVPHVTEEKVNTFFRKRMRRLFPDDPMWEKQVVWLVRDAEEIHNALLHRVSRLRITHDEQEALLRTLVCAMDFRSHYTALHCTMMVVVSDMLAEYFGLDAQARNDIHVGAMLHDLGKIAIPLEILESSGKLDGRAWDIMKSHVTITEDILKGYVSDDILQIAIRHHETLDGAGYPRGICGAQLTLPQRIVAVGDIVSALSEERSYKPAFPLQEVLNILRQMGDAGKICNAVIGMLETHLDEVYQAVLQEGRRVAHLFEQIYAEYYLLTEAEAG